MEISPDPVRSSLHLRLLFEDDRADGMESYSVPDKLQTVLVPVLGVSVGVDELTRSVGAVDFEAFLSADDGGVQGVADGEV